jgi:hypothetical protein
MNIHWRYNYGSKDFDWVDGNPIQYYQQLMDRIKIPTLIIDINLVGANDLELYLNFVLDAATKDNRPIIFKQLIFDASMDPVYDYDEKVEILNNFVKNKGIPGFLSLSQFEVNYHSHLVEIIHPSWFFNFKKQKLPELNLDQKQWKYSCLNRNPIWHRLMFYTMVKEKNLLDQFVYTFYDQCPYNDTIVNPVFYSENKTEKFFGDYYSKCMKNIPDLPLSWPNDIPGNNDHSLNHDAYINAECNIVTESSTSVSFTSEKIWKPIAAGQIFHVVGSAHTNKWLQSLGFHTFDTGYDSIIDNIQRIEAVANLLDKETMWDRKTLFHVEHNYHWFHSGAVEKAILDPLVVLLNQ